MNCPWISINGFHVGTTIKTVLNAVTRFISDVIYSKTQKNKRAFHNLSEQLDSIRKVMNKLGKAEGTEDWKNKYLLIAIHSFDMGSLKQAESIEMLA
jgi:hypothetical protein